MGKKALEDIVEKERQDRIELRKDRREDIKRKWKEVEWADKRVERFLIPAIKDRHKLTALTDGSGDSGSDGEGADHFTTVAFDVEDDDPFGGCEVTTTVGDVSSGGNIGESTALALAVEDASSRSALAKLEDPDARRQRRLIAWRTEEKIHKAAVTRKLNKREEGKKKRMPGGKRKERGRKAKRTKASARRRRAKK